MDATGGATDATTSYYLDQLNDGGDDLSGDNLAASIDVSVQQASSKRNNNGVTNATISTMTPIVIRKEQQPAPLSRVSSLIRVRPLDVPKTQQSCVVPMLPPTPVSQYFDIHASMDDILKSPEKQQMPENSSDGDTGLVLVTPHVIGNQIKPHITLETARMVAQVAHLETEDWARQYKNCFTHIEWISDGSDDGNTPSSEPKPFVQVARDMASTNDAHGVVLSMGEEHVQLLPVFLKEAFATALQQEQPASMLPLSPSSSSSSQEQCITLSILQIGSDKDMVDLLLPVKKGGESPPLLRVHHPDRQGGVVVNLTRALVDEEHFEKLLKQALSRNTSKDGIVVATLTIWPSAVDHELDRLSKCRYVQFVHLPSSAAASASTTVKRSTISLRQSLSSLGGILRHFVSDTDNLCSFRDCTLTKVLQRSLEPKTTEIVVVGTVSANVEHYERTVHTLNYIQQLFTSWHSKSSPFDGSTPRSSSKLFPTAQSPFDSVAKSMRLDTPSSSMVPEDLGKHPAFLSSKVSDPRQRIAELEKKMLRSASASKVLKSPPPQPAKKDTTVSPYQPTNYMDMDPLDFQSDYYKDPEEKKADSSMTASPPLAYRQEGSSILFGTSLERQQENDYDRSDPPAYGRQDIDENRADPPETGLSSFLSDDFLTFPKSDGGLSFLTSLNKTTDTPSLDYSFHEEEHQHQQMAEVPLQQLKSPLDKFIRKDDDNRAVDYYQDFEELQEIQESSNEEFNHYFEGEDILQGVDQATELQYSDLNDTGNKWKQVPSSPHEAAQDKMLRLQSPARGTTTQPLRKPSSFRPPTHRADSKISILTTDTDEGGGALVTTPGVPSSVTLSSALLKARSPKLYQHQRRKQQQNFPSPQEHQRETHFPETANGHVSPASSDASFMPDLLELQEAVEELRLNNSDSWEQKRKSLQRLQQHMVRKDSIHQKTVDELNEVEKQLRETEAEYNGALEQEATQTEKERETVERLKKALEKATSENTSYETVADKAAGMIQRLQEEVNHLKGDLSITEMDAHKQLLEYQAAMDVKEKLVDELRGVRNEASDLSMEHTESAALIADLKLQVQQVTAERDELKEQRNKDLTDMDELRLEIDDIADAETRLRTKDLEIDQLKQSNEDLSSTVLEMKRELSSEGDARQADRESMALKMQTLDMELQSAKRRLEDESGDRKRFLATLQEEQASLREKIGQVESERDKLQDLRDFDISEMENLKLEAAIRKDLEKRLRAAGVEIDRLRAERGKVHERIAAVRAEAASKIDEKDSTMQQLKVELHQAKIEANSLRRRSTDLDEEYERTTQLYEDENQRFAAKLSSANEELARLRSELEESVRVANARTNEASELVVAVKAGEDEVAALTTQLNHLKLDQAGIKEENKKLRESLYELRANTRAQVVGIAEKIRDTEALLEAERERTAILQTDNAHLSDSLEKSRREQEVHKDGLDSFRDDMNKLMKEKSEALTKVAHLEKELKDLEMTTEDFRHELELSKMRSNDELLRKAKEEYRSVHTSNVRLSEEIANLETERNDLNQDVSNIRDELEKTKLAKIAAETSTAQLESVCEQRQNAIEDLQHKLEIAGMRSNSEISKKAREENRAHQKLEAEMRIALEQLEAERNEYYKTLQVRTAELEKLARKTNELEGQVSTLASKLQITAHAREELKQELEAVGKHKESWEQKTEDLRQGLRATEDKRMELEQAALSLKAELEAAENMARELKRTKAEEVQVLRESRTVESATVQAMEDEIASMRQQISNQQVAATDELVIPVTQYRAEQKRLEDSSQLITTMATQFRSAAVERERTIRKLKMTLISMSEEKEREIHVLRERLHTLERSIVLDDEKEHYHWKSDGNYY